MQLMWKEEELNIIRSVFSKEEEIENLKNVFYQFSEETTTVYNEDTLKILRKVFIHRLNPEASFFNQQDAYWGLNTKELSPDVAVLQLQAEDLLNQYLAERLEILAGNKVSDGIVLESLKQGKDLEDRYVRMLAFQKVAGRHIPSCLNILLSLSKPEETEEQKQERLAKDSAK